MATLKSATADKAMAAKATVAAVKSVVESVAVEKATVIAKQAERDVLLKGTRPRGSVGAAWQAMNDARRKSKGDGIDDVCKTQNGCGLEGKKRRRAEEVRREEKAKDREAAETKRREQGRAEQGRPIPRMCTKFGAGMSTKEKVVLKRRPEAQELPQLKRARIAEGLRAPPRMSSVLYS